MPTGSKDTDVLLNWILDSIGLIRRKSESGGKEEIGTLHRIFKDALLVEPLKGWDTKSLGDVCGLSQTGMHHQMVKLRESGLVSAENDGRWHIYVLRGGSITAAIDLLAIQAKGIMELRLTELGKYIDQSTKRMETMTEVSEIKFKIKISEPSATRHNDDRLDALIDDLGFNGERAKEGDDLARNVFTEMAKSSNPVTILSLADKLSESRSRIQRTIDRLRSSNIIERVPMVDRIAQDVYIGMMRQYDARGEKWLLTRGGLGRIDGDVSKKLLSGVKKKSLKIEKVQEILEPVSLESQKLLLNTLGGRMPYGFRIAGSNGEDVKERTMRQVERVLRRLKTVAQRLEKSLSTDN